jgi:hypothetical protein
MARHRHSSLFTACSAVTTAALWARAKTVLPARERWGCLLDTDLVVLRAFFEAGQKCTEVRWHARLRAADLVVWWQKVAYAQEDEALREIIAAFEQGGGTGSS